MISGFNTDIEFDGVVYHVQTEDKGLSTRLIISLVYNRGTILASKRTPYDDLANGTFDENVLAERVQKQHKLISAAIKAGRIADLKKMSAKNASVTEASVCMSVAGVVPSTSVGAVGTVDPYVRLAPDQSQPIELLPDLSETEIVFAEEYIGAASESNTEQPVLDAISVIEVEDILPDEAVAVVSELSGQERTSNSKLGVELLGDFKFKGGDRLTVNIMVCRGTDRKVVADAQIMVKALGSSFRPVIFHAKSDANGLAKIHLQLPRFQAGRAALLVRAMDHGEEIELRRSVSPG